MSVQQQQQSSSIPECVHLQTQHDAAIATLKQANVLDAILVLINDGNRQPLWQRSAIGHIRSDIDSLRSVKEELKGLKKLSKLLIRPYMKHNLAGAPNVNIKIEFETTLSILTRANSHHAALDNCGDFLDVCRREPHSTAHAINPKPVVLHLLHLGFGQTRTLRQRPVWFICLLSNMFYIFPCSNHR